MFHLARNVQLPASNSWRILLTPGKTCEKKYLYFVCSCCPLLFQKCLGGALNAWSLSPVQTHTFLKQEPNWLSSMVLTRKNFCVVHSTAFVAGSHQEMSLFQRCLFVGSSLTQDMLSALSKFMISISNVY